MSLKNFTINNIDRILKSKNLTVYKASKKMKIKDNALYEMAKGRSKFSEKFIRKILPVLEISREEFESWIIADKYPKELLERAIQNKKEFPYKRKSIFTAKIDEILRKKGLSRTAFAKQIIYNQSALNAVIMGKRSVSETVSEKLSNAFEIPREEILSWSVADNYKLEILEKASALL